MKKQDDTALKIKEALKILSESKDDALRQEALWIIAKIGESDSGVLDLSINEFLKENNRISSLVDLGVFPEEWIFRKSMKYQETSLSELLEICQGALNEIIFRAFHFKGDGKSTEDVISPLKSLREIHRNASIAVDCLGEAYGDLDSLQRYENKNFINQDRRHALHEKTELNNALRSFLNIIEVARLLSQRGEIEALNIEFFRDGFIDVDEQKTLAYLIPRVSDLPVFNEKSVLQWYKVIIDLMKFQSRTGKILDHPVGEMLVENVDLKKPGTTMCEDYRLNERIRKRIGEALNRYIKQ